MKAVFFDFDGTLTVKGTNVWKRIWDICGYDTSKESYYALLYKKFIKNEISRQKWFKLTCDEFVKANLNKESVIKIAHEVKLIDGLNETLKFLKKEGFSLHIISGNIIQIINEILKDNVKYFDSINGNKMVFDKDGCLKNIIVSNYDFEGKAKFITKFKEKTGSLSKDLYFVGNGDNDEWAYLAGCKTICINPDQAETSNSKKWHCVKENVENLYEILPDICGNSEDYLIF